MPRGDRRGPNGMGSMTGRAAGFCNGAEAPGFMNSETAGGYGMGSGRGSGGRFHRSANGAGYGRGIGRARGMAGGVGFQPSNASPVYSKETEKGYLENEVSFLKNQLKTMETRLLEMESDK